MKKPIFKNCAAVGTGVIGRGWVRVFIQAGCRTRMFDPDLSQALKAFAWIEKSLREDVKNGFVKETEAEKQLTLISVHEHLEEALSEAEYIQESGPESLDIKKTIFDRIDQSAQPNAIIATSTSSLDINQIAKGLRGISRCIMAHPFNPPHIVPLVEVLPTSKTKRRVILQTLAFLKNIGQKPVLLNFYIKGFLANRIQAAVVREAIHLVTKGVASVEDVDMAMREGLGLRWAVLGSFATNHTNADGGIREYFTRFGKSYKQVMDDLDWASPSFDSEMIEIIGKGVDEMVGETPLDALCFWRDRMVRKIRALKSEDPLL